MDSPPPPANQNVIDYPSRGAIARPISFWRIVAVILCASPVVILWGTFCMIRWASETFERLAIHSPFDLGPMLVFIAFLSWAAGAIAIPASAREDRMGRSELLLACLAALSPISVVLIMIVE